MAAFTEKDTVQNPIVEYAKQIGWEHISAQEMGDKRQDNKDIILRNIFLSQAKKLNPSFSEDEISRILKDLESLSPNIEGNFAVWEHLKGVRAFYVNTQKRDLNVKLIDTDNIENNTFHISDEFSFTNGINKIRQDIVFFINGIPIIFVEAKAPHIFDGIDIALTQVTRYHKETPELLAIEQFYLLTNITRLMYGATWNLSSKKLYNWKEEIQGNFETLVKSFFDKQRIIRLLTGYILFTRKDDILEKAILRSHQIRAVEKIVERAMDKEKKRALIWHTQGSGKTYTMIVSAKKIIENPDFNNPTVIMLVDRTELESQLFNNLKACGFENVKVASSKKDLEIC